MRLHAKAISIGAAVVFVTSLGIYFVSLQLIRPKFDRLEQQRVRLNANRIENAFRHEIEHLEDLAADYATWDSTYRYLGHRYAGYAKSEISDQTFTGYHLQLFLLIDTAGQVALCRDYAQNHSLCGEIETINRIIAAARSLAGPKSEIGGSGVAVVDRGPMLLAVRPVLKTNGAGPSRGLLVLGKLIADRTALSLSHLLAFPIQVLPTDTEMAQKYTASFASVSGTDHTFVESVDSSVVSALVRVDDFDGKPAMFFRTELNRDLHHEGLLVQRALFVELFIVVLLMALAAFWILQKGILRPIAALSQTATLVTNSGDLSARAVIRANDEFGNLGRAFNTMLEELEASRKELLIVQDALEYRVRHDGLTGVLSRHAVLQELMSESARCAREGITAAVMMADLDGFKQINDDFGHAEGDEALRRTAEVIRAALRPYDRLGRFGGDELLIVTPTIDRDDAIRLAERVREAVSSTAPAGSSCRLPTISIGVTLISGREDWHDVVSAADAALYRAKHSGRNRVEFLAHSIVSEPARPEQGAALM